MYKLILNNYWTVEHLLCPEATDVLDAVAYWAFGVACSLLDIDTADVSSSSRINVSWDDVADGSWVAEAGAPIIIVVVVIKLVTC